MLRSDVDPSACQSAHHIDFWVDFDMVYNHHNSLSAHPKKKNKRIPTTIAGSYACW
jgi:hypothetical protein